MAPAANGVDFLGYNVRRDYLLVRRRVVGHLRERLRDFEQRLVTAVEGGLRYAFDWPVLDELAGNISHVGGPGAGHTMKIINQVIVGISIQTVAEGIALAEAAGFSVAEVQAATRGGNADNAQLRVMAPRMGARFYDPPGAKVKTMAKDLRLALRLAREHGLELPQLEIALARYETLEAGGRADQDVSSLIELLRKPAAPGSGS